MSAERQLGQFCAHCEALGATRITIELALGWATQCPANGEVLRDRAAQIAHAAPPGQVVDPALGDDVALAVYARAADQSWPELTRLAAMDSMQRQAFSAQYRGKLRTIAERQAALSELTPAPRKPPPPARDPDFPLPRVMEFRDDDEGYLAWLVAHPDGYVINILRGLNPATARVHSAGCRTITGTPPRGGPWTGPYIKVCANELNELDR